MRPGIRNFVIMFAVYILLVFSPFFIPALNQEAPYLLGMPLTMWYTHVVIIIGCVLIFCASRKLWVSFDDCEDEGAKEDLKNE